MTSPKGVGMSDENVLDKKTMQQIKQKLIHRLGDLQASLRLHEAETSERLPENDKEAITPKNEMDIVELEEKSESEEIELIRIALDKIENASYGICELCQKSISLERLKAVPCCRFCFECQKDFEVG